jgi:hypothetical protein
VSGRLIADVALLPAGRSPLVHPLPAAVTGVGGASVAHGTPASWPMVAAAVALGLALLGLGAARELRGR